MQIKHNKAEKEKLKNIPDPVDSYDNGECEFVRSVLTSYMNDNLPDDFVWSLPQNTIHQKKCNFRYTEIPFSINPFKVNVPFLY